MESAEYLWTATRVLLEAIQSTDEALHNLGKFAFVTSHLFSTGGRHSSVDAELLNLIDRLEDLHTNAQGIIFSPHLAKTLLYDVPLRWILYLKRCVAVSASEDLEVLGTTVIFTLYPILLKMEGGSYVGPLIPGNIMNLLSEQRSGGSRGGGGSISSGGISSGSGGGKGGGGTGKII